MLMRAFCNFLDNKIGKLHRNNIRLRVIGRDRTVSSELLTRIRKAERLTVGNTGLTLVLAFNYSGRAEIVDAATKLAQSIQKNTYKINQLSEEIFSRFLYAPDLPSPDLLIRTSGELRLSNFLLWQLAYTELYFVEKYWPSFTKNDLIKAIDAYQKRERRFGGL